jgi:hypothetical protein
MVASRRKHPQCAEEQPSAMRRTRLRSLVLPDHAKWFRKPTLRGLRRSDSVWFGEIHARPSATCPSTFTRRVKGTPEPRIVVTFISCESGRWEPPTCMCQVTE